MSLSPLDVAKHEFSRAFRGYDPAEVHAFLDRLADEIGALQSQVNSLAEQNRIYGAKLTAYQELDQNLRDSLLAAQDNAKTNREAAVQEREQLLREAQLDAEQLRFSVERDLVRMREELRALKLHRDSYVKRLRFLLRAHTELIDLLEEENPEPPHASTETTDH